MPQHQQIKLKYYHVFVVLNKEVNRQNILKQGFVSVNCHASLVIIYSVKPSIYCSSGELCQLYPYYGPETRHLDGKALQLHWNNRDQVDLLKSCRSNRYITGEGSAVSLEQCGNDIGLIQCSQFFCQLRISCRQHKNLLKHPLLPLSVDIAEGLTKLYENSPWQ